VDAVYAREGGVVLYWCWALGGSGESRWTGWGSEEHIPYSRELRHWESLEEMCCCGLLKPLELSGSPGFR